MSKACVECGKLPSWMLDRQYHCESCQRGPLCATCANHATIDGTMSSGNWRALTVCIDCAKRRTTIDFTRHEDIMGPENGTAPCVMLVHGGGSARKMFASLTLELVAAGFRCVLPDLPGHGSRWDQPLTLESCVETIRQCKEQHCAAFRGIEPIYVGGSFGGYTGMEAVGRYPGMFSATVVLVATQTVGKGAGLAARMGLGALGLISNAIWCSTMVKGFLGAVKKEMATLNLPALDRDSVGSGWWFEQGQQQCNVLRACDSQGAMKAFRGPVLYISGELDHRDMEPELLRISRQNELLDLQSCGTPHPARTQSLIYPKVGHFLSHDVRTMDRFHADVVQFCRQVVSDAVPELKAIFMPAAAPTIGA